jgi:subtilisin family serine protease
MKKLSFLFSMVILLALIGCQKEDSTIVSNISEDNILQKSGDIIDGQYIIIFNEKQSGLKSRGSGYPSNLNKITDQARELFQKSMVTQKQLKHVYASALEGFAVSLTKAEFIALSKNPEIKIYPDRFVMLAKPVPVPVQPPQSVPYGIARVGYQDYTGTHLAWIIDTGIDLNHPDLNVNTALAKTFVLRTTTAEDDNGHGTHCAGIVAAKNNTIGVIGVASNAYVVPVKVLDKRGSGALSTIIAGIDYVAANSTAGDAANLSLGGSAYDPIDQAVINLGLGGVYVAMAAGNESDDANNHSPARANGLNLYTISACDINDNWATFSNYGNPPIDFCAPGVNVYSTYKGDAYATMSGTSMASPHVCGLLLLTNGNVQIDGYVNGDPDGTPDPIAHK